MVLKRRELLTRMLVGTGVALSAPIIEAASAVASPLESSEFDRGLGEVTRRLYRIGHEHMQFQADPMRLMADAAAAWRDAVAFRSIAPSRAIKRATDAEAFAAGLIAGFFGDRGQLEQAQSWYAIAWRHAMEPHVKSWLVGCQTWLPLYVGNGEVAVQVAMRARNFQTYRDPERIVFTQMQAARAHALAGNTTQARRAFWEAESQFQKSECDTHRASAPNLLHFTQWQYYQYAAEIMGAVGKFGYAREYNELAMASPHLNGMNKAVMGLNESFILSMEGDALGASAHAIAMVSEVKKVDATSAPVRGRINQLSKKLRLDYGDVTPVHELEEFAASLAQAA